MDACENLLAVEHEQLTADEIVALLRLEPHPEGGHFVETWRHTPEDGSRGAGSAIYFLLKAGHDSAPHRVDADETWHHYSGAPLELTVEMGDETRVHELGSDLRAGQRPQYVVPAGAWQSARTLGAWTLVGCTVSPAFNFEGFELRE